MILAILKKYKLKLQHPSVQCSKTAFIHNVGFGEKNIVAQNAFLSNVLLGDFSSIGRNTTIHNAELGKFCSISWNCTIGATSHPYTHISTHAFPYHSFFGISKTTNKIKIKTIVGNDVWIGANAIIMPGVSIGNGAVIGAGSIVTKNVPDYAIIAGNPAVIKKLRFTESTIRELNKIQWWNWSNDKLKNLLAFFKEPLNEKTLSLLLQQIDD